MRDNDGFAGLAMKTKSALSLLLLSSLPMFCSDVAQAQGAPPGGGTVTETRPDSIQDTGYWGYMANAPGGIVGGPGLWGKVVVAGDPLIWEPITVALSCANGRTDLTTDTGPDGRFAITHVHLPGAYQVDGDVRRQMEQHYEGCTVHAELAGYRSTVDTITEKNLRDNPYLANLVLSPEENAPGTATSAMSSSPEGMKAFEKAHEEWLHRNTAAAKSDLEEAVKADPKFAEAWYLLGRLQAVSDLKAATESLTQAQAADPRFVLPCVWLATIAIQKKDWQDASNWAGRALALDPTGTARIWYDNALVDYRLGKNEAARASAEHALAMDPEHTVRNAEEVLALTLINKGDYAGALDHLRNSLTYTPAGPDTDLIKRQIAFVQQRAADAKK
jgi:tetratricopeptide (TPR) repeat protein